MSFPYTTSAVPPTNGPLPVVESANLSSGSYGGGGGGPIGPNPVVSSITFAQNVGGPTAYTQGVLNMSTQLVIQDFGTPVLQDFVIQTGFPTPTDFTSSFVSTTNVFSVNGPGGDGNNGGLNMFGSADGRTMITSLTATSVVSSLAIIADPVVIPFDLRVSSINGAAPGGGVGPSLTLSTLNVVGQGSVSSLSVSSINGAAPGGSVSPDLTLSTLNVVGQGSVSSLSVSSVNGSAYLTSGTGTNFVNNLGSGINPSNSMIYTNGKFQVIQFDVGVSSILNTGASPTAFFIPMDQAQITPGNWAWAQNFTPNVSMCGLASTENYVGGVQTINLQMAGDPGTNNQVLQVWGSFADTNYQPNYRITLTGLAP